MRIVFIILIFFFSLLSPYDYEWAPGLAQIDDDKLLVLRMVWILIAGTDAVFWSISKPKKIWRYFLYGFIMLLAVIKIVYLFLIVQ